jgi:hypothetical protein
VHAQDFLRRGLAPSFLFADYQEVFKEVVVAYVVSLGLAIIGAVIALIAGFGFDSIQGVVIGFVITFIGFWFRPRRDK